MYDNHSGTLWTEVWRVLNNHNENHALSQDQVTREALGGGEVNGTSSVLSEDAQAL